MGWDGMGWFGMVWDGKGGIYTWTRNRMGVEERRAKGKRVRQPS